MRGTIIVESQEEFDFWMAKQKPKFYLAHPDKDPKRMKAKADSSNINAAVVPQKK
jgi:cytochrome c oxidase subunit 2